MANLAYLNALKAFEATARHCSFSAAAAELNVTAAAVGQQVRSLENWLGIALFIRTNSGSTRLALTDAALSALPDLVAGFQRLNAALARLQAASDNHVLTVTASPAFAAKWLLPRIEHFQSAHPQTDLRLDTNLRSLDFQAHGIDIGVRYGKGDWPELVAEPLLGEAIYPVCSPRLLQAGLNAPDDLQRFTLIHDLSMADDPGFPSWRTWLDAAGYPAIDAERGLRINNSAAVLQAAIDGHGVALGRSVMVHDDLAAGHLVRPFGLVDCPQIYAYYVVYRQESTQVPRIMAFRDWLQAEAAGL